MKNTQQKQKHWQESYHCFVFSVDFSEFEKQINKKENTKEKKHKQECFNFFVTYAACY